MWHGQADGKITTDAADAGGVQCQRVVATRIFQQRSIALTTFDYWRREHGAKPGQRTWLPRMVKVEVAASESSWRFAEAELARLIRIAESV